MAAILANFAPLPGSPAAEHARDSARSSLMRERMSASNPPSSVPGVVAVAGVPGGVAIPSTLPIVAR